MADAQITTDVKALPTNVKAIKAFFEADPNGRPITLEEIKTLSQAEREELGSLCREALSSS